MTTIFMICAVIGGTILVCQFVLSLVGLTDSGADIADDVPSDAEIDFDAGEVSAESAGHGASGHTHLSEWFFGVLSFRTIVAFLAFFGLSGMAAHAANATLGMQFLIALASGITAMYVMHGIMRGLRQLTHDGTLRIERAIGATGTVYLPIPANRANTGKVHITLQQRQVEFEAITLVGARLPAGAKVVVTGVMNGDTLEVEPLPVDKPEENTPIPMA